MLPYVQYGDNNENWNFDLYYDATASEWKVEIAEGTEGYYRGIEEKIEAIRNDSSISNDEREIQIKYQTKKRIVVEDIHKNTTTLGSEQRSMPFTKAVKYITVGMHSFNFVSLLNKGSKKDDDNTKDITNTDDDNTKDTTNTDDDNTKDITNTLDNVTLGP